MANYQTKYILGKRLGVILLAFSLIFSAFAIQQMVFLAKTEAAATYSMGAQGKGVKTLQQKLNKNGADIGVDSIYGVDTRNAVKSFQKDKSLAVDGIAGPDTHKALNNSKSKKKTSKKKTSKQTATYRIGSQGKGVKKLQKDLSEKGYKTSADGIYGANTAKVVKDLQQDAGITADGIAGPDTHKALDDAKKKKKEKQKSKKNKVDKMTTLGDSEQVILVTTDNMDATTGTLETYEKKDGNWKQVMKDTAYVGKSGLSDPKQEGDLGAPVGKFSLGDAFGYEGDPGTKLDYRDTKQTDVWVDDPDSDYYNTLQSTNSKNKDWDSAEDMNHELYANGIEINYNESNTPGEGSAIFLHANDSYTVGCTATPPDSLKEVMTWVDPAKDPVIVQTPESGLANF